MKLSPKARAVVITLGVAAGVALGGLGFKPLLRDQLIARNFSEVHPGVLYRAGRLTPATTQRVVREHAIRTIIDLGAYDDDSPPDRLAQRTAQALGVTRHKFHLLGDGTGDPQQYVQALRLIADPANQPVLVHCAAGAQRTSACVMFYRRAFEGVAFETSYAEALEHKHNPQRNPELWPYVQTHGEAIVREVLDAVNAPAPR